MDNFEKNRESIKISFDEEPVSPELRPLIKDVYQHIIKQPPNFSEIKVSLEKLFTYLTSSTGRTSANCYATDLFFAIADWNVDWEIYPERLKEIIGDIGGTLHDTISHPKIAENFDSLPEQLLERVRNWDSNLENQ